MVDTFRILKKSGYSLNNENKRRGWQDNGDEGDKIKRTIISMTRIFVEMCSKPEIFLAFVSKSNYSMIIVLAKLFAILETMSGY